MTLEQTLKNLKAAFTSKSTEAEAFAKELSEFKAKNDTLAAELANVNEQLVAASAFVAEREALVAQVAEMTKALATAEAQKVQAVEQIETAAVVGAKIAAAVGVAPVEIAVTEIAAASKSPAEIWEEYVSIKDPAEKLAFYNKNRAACLAFMGIK
jgi:chromosome segregation ATPase